MAGCDDVAGQDQEDAVLPPVVPHQGQLHLPALQPLLLLRGPPQFSPPQVSPNCKGGPEEMVPFQSDSDQWQPYLTYISFLGNLLKQGCYVLPHCLT